jgi:hypothetical protein
MSLRSHGAHNSVCINDTAISALAESALSKLLSPSLASCSVSFGQSAESEGFTTATQSRRLTQHTVHCPAGDPTQRQGESSTAACATSRQNARHQTEAAPRRINVMRRKIREYQPDSPSRRRGSPAGRCTELPAPNCRNPSLRKRKPRRLTKRPSISAVRNVRPEGAQFPGFQGAASSLAIVDSCGILRSLGIA